MISITAPVTHSAGTVASVTCVQVDATILEGRVFVRYPLRNGTVLKLFTDTGGGGSVLSREAAALAGAPLGPLPSEAAQELGPAAATTTAPPTSSVVLPPMPGPVVVLPSAFPVPGWPERVDGILGQSWFAGRRWTWDYAAGKLLLGCSPRGHRIALGLPAPNAELPRRQFPRVTVSIDGVAVGLLVDTGATTWLTDEALRALGDGRSAIRATSMATASRIAGWRDRHPGWRVIEHAQRGTGARMIEVPDLLLGGVRVGPVWFTERPDASFTRVMSAMMDGPVEGALGANAFEGMSLTLDYARASAWIYRKPNDAAER